MIKGNNLMLLNMTYIKEDKSKNIKECFEVIYKDVDTNKVYVSYEDPTVDIYITKEEYRDHSYNKPQELMSKLNKVECNYSDIPFQIASAIGKTGLDFMFSALREKDFNKIKHLYLWPYCYKCDFQPEYYYLSRWQKEHELPIKAKPSKAFLDIETDILDNIVDLKNIRNSANAPVNLMTLILDETNESYTFILEPHEPKKLNYSDKQFQKRVELYQKQLKAHEWLLTHKDEFIKNLHDRFDQTYGTINYHLRIYKSEIEMIKDLFQLLHQRKPNFVLIWNMRFDIQYLYYRIIELGYDPADIMCHPDFKYKRCYFKEDNTTQKLVKQFDYFYVSSYSQFICQMRTYGSIRKSQHALRSLSLNAISDIELKDRKVDYPSNTNIRTFPYEDWITFIIYNIKDVLLQVGIERKVNDMMTYYKRMYSNQTPYNKIFRETHLLRNYREKYFESIGYVQSNNINIIDTKDTSAFATNDQVYDFDDDEDNDDNSEVENETSFKGAIVADPIYNDSIGEVILGIPTNYILKNLIDMDMGSFYPSVKIASNMDPMTLEFKAYIDTKDYIDGKYPNKSLNTSYYERDKKGKLRYNDVTGECINTYMTENVLTFGYNWLNLPDITEIIEELSRKGV